jgi:ribosomal protein S7
MRYFKLRPRLTYKSLRIAGQVQYIPCPITAERQKYLAFKWFFDSASRRSENGFSLRIKSELLDILRGRGESIRRRRDHYAIVRANRALLTNRNFYELQVETRCHV